jgi:hypothetical protein
METDLKIVVQVPLELFSFLNIWTKTMPMAFLPANIKGEK